jgi:hypothetical protein
MRKVAGLTVAFAVAGFIGGVVTASARMPPEPRSIAGKCNKEVGGHYDWLKKQWVVRASLIMAKNACVQRMMEKGR